jgi:hypothetical protein
MMTEHADQICLVVVFNHRFEKNIPKLEALYRGRFSHVYYVVPFLQGDARDNVIGVYGSSYCFEVYLAQAYSRIVDPRFSHYVFVADDMLLNPELNEHNLIASLGLDERTGYIKSVRPLTELEVPWEHGPTAVRALSKGNFYVQYRRELPPQDQAEVAFRNHGLALTPYTLKNVMDWSGLAAGETRLTSDLFWLLQRCLRGKAGGVYPLAISYSDFLVVPQEAFAAFSRYCGAFGSAGIHVEVALPTAMLLACERVHSEANTTWSGHEIWQAEELQALIDEHDGDLDHLLTSYSERLLYVHPIKLSQWKSALIDKRLAEEDSQTSPTPLPLKTTT